MGLIDDALIAFGAALIGAVVGAWLSSKWTRRTERIKTEIESVRRDREVCERLGEDLGDWYNGIATIIRLEGFASETLKALREFHTTINFERRVHREMRALGGQSLCRSLIEKAQKFEEVAKNEKGQLMSELRKLADLRNVNMVEQKEEYNRSTANSLRSLREIYIEFNAELETVIEQLQERERRLRTSLY